MERLVSKEKLEMALKIISTTSKKLVEDIYLKNAKLGKLEDIEEELGIDLATLFKALKNGVYMPTKTSMLFIVNVLKLFITKMGGDYLSMVQICH